MEIDDGASDAILVEGKPNTPDSRINCNTLLVASRSAVSARDVDGMSQTVGVSPCVGSLSVILT